MPEEQLAHPRYLVFQTCPVCKGRRFASGFVPCKECSGLGVYYVSQRDIIFWSYRLDASHILLRSWNLLVKRAIDGILILLLVANIFILFRLGLATNFAAREWLDLLFVSRADLVGSFWFLLLCNLYLFYRIYRDYLKSRGNLAGGASRAASDARRAKGRRINIADVLHPSVVRLLDEAWPYVMRSRQLPIRPLQLFGVMFEDRDILMILARLGLSQELLLDALRRQIAYYPPLSAHDALSPEVQNIMLNAYLTALAQRSRWVRITDVFLATVLADEKIQHLLEEYGVDLTKVKNVIAWIHFNNALSDRYRRYRSQAVYKPKGPINRSFTAAATPLLDSFSADLTQQARAGALPLSVAREKEVEELFRVMEGGRSVILVGEKGVGKRNIIEGLANRMVAEDVPKLFEDKRLVSLSVPFLVAGAARTGEVHQRLLLIIQEILRSGNIILVVEDIDNLVGVSSAGTENVDLSEVIAQQIQQHAVRVIGTTTTAHFTEYIERSALFGVLERVPIGEPSRNQTIQILEAHVGFVESKYKTFFTYEALERIVDLAGRYLHDAFFPKKAIDILAEAASWVSQREMKLVSGEDIAALVSRKTSVPLTQVSAKESSVLMNLEAIMHERIIGQDEAVKLVVSALRRARAELRDERRPIVNLLFLGPTGVGKTELAKTVAASYFGSEKTMIRLDMSEYQAQDSIARLLGAPGSGRGGILTESVRKNPFVLLLLDEIEKAHPDILNIFLQVMDDGRLTDALGRTVDFTSVILVATSNAGAHYIQDEIVKGSSVETIKNGLIRGGVLRGIFNPEFLNRFDGIVVFKPLTESEVFQVAGLMLRGVARRLSQKGITLSVTKEAQLELSKAGFDPIFGARPLRRVIAEQVDDALAKYLLQGKIGRRDEVVFDVGGKITVNKAERL